MGCHTWCYTISNKTEEEAKKIWIKELKENIHANKSIISDKNWGGINWLEYDEGVEGNDDRRKEEIILSLEKIEEIGRGECSTKEIFINQPELCVFHKGKFYVDVDDYHDLFRRGGYPDDILTSFDETRRYINDRSNGCKTFDFTDGKIKEFWDKYPQGLIDFG
jgi:hypothetical protein